MDKTGRGIVIIALGNVQYGNMAANLASSIRFADKDINIHLVHTESSITHLTAAHKALFTSMSLCPVEYYTKNGKTVFLKAKTCVYDLSPFEYTLMLDADMIWFSDHTFKNATTVFESLKEVDLTFQNRGCIDLRKEELPKDYIFWCDINEVKEKYFEDGFVNEKEGLFYHLHSEFVYFNRSKENRIFFTYVQTIFNSPQVKTVNFDGDIPDELAFDIAIAITGLNPHQDMYLPIHWFNAEGRFDDKKDRVKYFGMSIGGNQISQAVLDRYNKFAKFYAKALKLPYHFNAHPKKRWSATRQNM